MNEESPFFSFFFLSFFVFFPPSPSGVLTQLSHYLLTFALLISIREEGQRGHGERWIATATVHNEVKRKERQIPSGLHKERRKRPSVSRSSPGKASQVAVLAGPSSSLFLSHRM